MIKPSDLNSQYSTVQYNNNNFYCFICVYYYSTCNLEIKLPEHWNFQYLNK